MLDQQQGNIKGNIHGFQRSCQILRWSNLYIVFLIFTDRMYVTAVGGRGKTGKRKHKHSEEKTSV